MDNSNRWNCQRVLNLLGSMLLFMPGAVDWVWGDISVYVFSFVLSRDSSKMSVETPWIVSLYTMSWITALILEGTASKLIKRQWMVLIAVVIQDLSLFMCHFAIQNSWTLFNFTFSVLPGIAQGFLYGNSIHIVIKTANNDEGFLSSMLLIVTPLSGLLLSQVSTWFANPQNKAPNWTRGSTMYFTQGQIIDKVPSMFLVIGGIALILHTLALILLQTHPDMRFIMSTCSRESDRIPLNKDICQTKTQFQTEDDQENETENSHCPPCENTDIRDFTSKEMLKTVNFYVLWISTFMCEIPYILLLNYFKLYGQIWIRDDHFLTYLGTAFMLLIAICRIPWGLAMDKFNSQYCLIALLSSLILIQAWYYFTPMVGRWTYFFVTCFYGVFSGSAYGCFCSTVPMLYGKKHVSTNTGLLFTSALAVNFCTPLVVGTVLETFGWFAVFASSAGLNIISLTLLCRTNLNIVKHR